VGRLLICVWLAVGLAACGDQVQISLARAAHYDDFPGPGVDLTKWSVDTTGSPGNGTSSVSVAGGVAVLDLTAASGDIQGSLVFPSALAPSIGRIEARVTLLTYAETPGSIVRFRLYTRPYKDDKYASGGPPDTTSDIFAQLRIRAAPVQETFQAIVSRCIDSSCASEVIFGAANLGPAIFNQPYDVALAWDGVSGFYFNVGGVGSAYFDASEGGVYAPVGPSGLPRSKVEVIADSGAPTSGATSANVDYAICARVGGGLC
jgi:hypothetical protein